MKTPLGQVLILLCAFVSIGVCNRAGAQAWPTYRNDNARSGISNAPIAAARLESAWNWRADVPPDPAWDGPARWDAYNRIRDLPAMRQYDACFHVVSDGTSVFFGSSSQDTLYSLRLSDGTLQWSFVAGGPIRLAPSIDNDRLFFGCDDGNAYCLDKASGDLIWKFNPSAERSAAQRRLINNDRLISYYPIRTGVTVRDGLAYFGASFLPWRESYICAIDAKSGKLDTSLHTFIVKHDDATLEGNLLVAENRLIMPQGRVAPLLFNRTTGEGQGSLPGGGGITIVITESGDIVRTEGGRASRAGQLGVFQGKERVASFARGRSLVIQDQFFYVIDGQKLFAADRATNELKWTREIDEPLEIIMAGDTIFVGCRDQVIAVEAADGETVWTAEIDGRVFGLAVAGDRLVASTDSGHIHVFAPTSKKDWSKSGTDSADVEVPLEPDADVQSFVSWGPLLRFVSPATVEITYGTKTKCASVVDLLNGDDATRFVQNGLRKRHKAVFDSLPYRRRLHFQIRESDSEGTGVSQRYAVDTHFDWTVSKSVTADAWAAEVVRESPNSRGMALVIGKDLITQAERLALASQFSVVLQIADEDDATDIRNKWKSDSRLHYGRALCVTTVPVRQLPAAFASVVIAKQEDDSARRLVRPQGGILHNGDSVVWRRDKIKGSGTWTHMYGQADNSAFGGERLSDATDRGDLVTQWIGRPGPRYQTDRQNRKPSPLAAGGRLFLQGQQRLIALDSYSGAVLWSAETPTVMRWNVPHDCSNWCADDEGIYVAVEDKAWLMDGRTGEITRQFVLPDDGDSDNSWGYISRYRDQLLGTVVAAPAIYKQWWGKSKWFDSTGGDDTHVVAGDLLFSLDAKSGVLQWTYPGLILHPTITVMDNQVFFVEDKTEEHLQGSNRRISLENGQAHELVCLDVVTGKLKWRRPLATFSGHLASLYLAGGGSRTDRSLVLVASESTKKEFTVQALNPETGEPIWRRSVGWEATHHGKHISRPAIQGELLYVRPEVMNLADGETIRRGFPGGHGCSSYTLSTNGLFSRLGETTWWDVRHDKVNRFSRIRTDCWISVVPAQGMLLSAEGGGGCSCGTWLETSLGFLPRSVDEELPEK